MRTSRLNLICIIGVAMVCLLVCACGDSQPPPEEPKLNLGLRTMTGQNVDQDDSAQTEDSAATSNEGENGEIEAFEVLEEDKLYSGSNKVNPFVPLIQAEVATTGDGNDDERRVPQTPLERFDIGQLSLSAIVEAPGGNSAIVVESSGRGYVVKAGTYIGLNGGQIIEIKSDRIIIEEPIGKNERGEVKVNTIELILPKPAGAF